MLGVKEIQVTVPTGTGATGQAWAQGGSLVAVQVDYGTAEPGTTAATITQNGRTILSIPAENTEHLFLPRVPASDANGAALAATLVAPFITDGDIEVHVTGDTAGPAGDAGVVVKLYISRA